MAWSSLVIAGVVVGIVFWGGFNWALELTNTESFCISCHEMRDNVYQELKGTIHWANRSGVRATCPDCHVPHPWIYKIRRKIQASNEVLHKILGTIDTREKFEAHRLELAQHVWDTMKSTDSRECRNCHAVEFDGSEEAIGSGSYHARSDQGGSNLHRLPQGHRASPSQRTGRIQRYGKKVAGISTFQAKCPDCDFLAISEGGIEAHRLVNDKATDS